ncbi:MAG: hypothetical protein Q4P18_08115 [Methanobrevibacter sp.]|uniref:hypothetical protein n=1 Tax=Methanobrevibacter sp. TaxID=66852 RepID=UPI0026DF4D09|nr:hypothetical protein [Methanobrevibacter sp.]MDO5849486.1 hypothetical protein [Methanobrevibacter sp.]
MKSYFDFNQFFFLGEVMLDAGDLRVDEISFQCIYRTVINRIYYACFNHAKEWLDVKYGIKTRVFDIDSRRMINKKNKSEHRIVYEGLWDVAKMVPPNRSLLFRELSSILKNMFVMRKDADYNLCGNITLNDVNEVISKGMKIFENLKFREEI